MKRLPFLVLFILALIQADVLAQPPYVRNVLSTNPITLGSGLSLSGVGVLSSTGGSVDPTNAVLSNIIGTGALTNTAILVTNLVSTASLSVILSNAPNTGSIFRLGAGTFTVTPRIAGIGNPTYPGSTRAINLFSKTNLTVIGIPGQSIIDGGSTFDNTNNLGEVLLATNCLNLYFYGVTFKGQFLTNFTLYTNSAVMSIVGIYNCRNVTFENCTFMDGFDHGIIDIALSPGLGPHSTNVSILRGLVTNIGSQRTNITVAADGTGIVPTGWLIDGVTFRDNWRHVEPFDDNDGYPFTTCIIRNCDMRNSIDMAITMGGSTNGHGVRIENNYIAWDSGYTRRGSNVNAFSSAIQINGGQRPIIKNNRIFNALDYAINGLVNADVYNEVIQDNIIDTVNTGAAQGFGIVLGDGSATAVRHNNALIKGNFITKCKSVAIAVYASRNATIDGNQLIDPIVSGGTYAINLDDVGNNVCSNNIVMNNVIIDNGTADMTVGIGIDAGTRATILSDNFIFNASSASIEDNSSAGQTRYFSYSLIAGANVTFTTNGSTITIGSSGGGSGGSATNALTRIATNGVTVSGSVTGLNLVAGANTTLSVTNNSGNVSVGIASTGGGGTPGGGTTMLEFNWAGAFDATNEFVIQRGSGAAILVSNTSPVSGQLRLNAGSLIHLSGGPGLSFGTAGLTNWGLSTSGHWYPGLSNFYDFGLYSGGARTNYANDFVAFEAVTTPQLSLTGSSPGNSSYYDAAGTEYSQFMAPLNVQSNNVTRLWTNATSGIVVAQPDGVGSNQLVNLMPGPGQYVTGNGTILVVSNLPAGGSGGGLSVIGTASLVTPEIIVHPITLLPTWVRRHIDDTFVLFGDNVVNTPYSGIFTTGGGGLAQQIVQPNLLPRYDRNGFGRLLVYATNAVGATHYAALYHQVNTATYTFQTNHLWEAIVGFEDSCASNIVQMGLLQNIISTNQPSMIGWEWNPQFYGLSNWVFKTSRAGSSMLYTSTFPMVLGQTWAKLAWEGNTNSIIAYTNGVAAFTNSTVSTIPGGTNTTFFPGIHHLNGQINSPGSSMTHSLFIDSVKLFRE